MHTAPASNFDTLPAGPRTAPPVSAPERAPLGAPCLQGARDAAGTVKFSNPIIPGFHPDPSICRAGEDFYLVTSSFEYFPGVPIFHSRDLVSWRLIGHCLTRRSQLQLDGVKASDGIYAPTIRFHEGRFYMVVTSVVLRENGTKTTVNFYVTAGNPAGEWSEPIFVEQRGIDPSLFFDADGKVYFTSNGTGWAEVRGAYQCEIDIATGSALTETRFLWPGTGGQYPEAPHLFKRGDFYYLMLAEGGTEAGHMVTISRSASPWGPFEPCPRNPLLTHRSVMSPIAATGHADFVEDQHGNWWAVFLGIRWSEYGWHHLGRETFLAPMRWDADGWPEINGGKPVALQMEVESGLPPHPWPAEPERDDFEGGRLGLSWNFLRNPREADCSLAARPGWLRLRCAPATLDDLDSPAFIGRRQEHFICDVSTLIDFSPQTESEEAGLTVLIDNQHHCEVAIALRGGRRTAIVRRRIGTLVAEVACEPLPDEPAVVLWIKADRTHYAFGFQTSGGAATTLARGETRYLSTEVAGGYTGVYLGIYATGRGTASDNAAFFDWFRYSAAAKESL